MYGTTPRSVVLHLSPDEPCSPSDRAELIRSLEAERIPNGLAFVSRLTDAPEFDDSLPAIVARRKALEAALDEPTAAEWDRRTARLRGVA